MKRKKLTPRPQSERLQIIGANWNAKNGREKRAWNLAAGRTYSPTAPSAPTKQTGYNLWVSVASACLAQNLPLPELPPAAAPANPLPACDLTAVVDTENTLTLILSPSAAFAQTVLVYAAAPSVEAACPKRPRDYVHIATLDGMDGNVDLSQPYGGRYFVPGACYELNVKLVPVNPDGLRGTPLFVRAVSEDAIAEDAPASCADTQSVLQSGQAGQCPAAPGMPPCFCRKEIAMFTRFTLLVALAGALFTLSLPSHADTASDIKALQASVKALQSSVATLQSTVSSQAVTIKSQQSIISLFSKKTDPTRADAKKGTELFLTGMNLHVVSGRGSTNDGGGTLSGLGNVIIGYNTARGNSGDVRTGSHNLVVGDFNNFSSYGGTVVGYANIIGGPYASVSGGFGNAAFGLYASVSGGSNNDANNTYASVSGGYGNLASGPYTSVSGGYQNTATYNYASISGGQLGTASGFASSISGGDLNQTTGEYASVTGGYGNMASATVSSVTGGYGNTASGDNSSVTGGGNNSALANASTVSGGKGRGANTNNKWVAGGLTQDN